MHVDIYIYSVHQKRPWMNPSLKPTVKIQREMKFLDEKLITYQKVG